MLIVEHWALTGSGGSRSQRSPRNVAKDEVDLLRRARRVACRRDDKHVDL